MRDAHVRDGLEVITYAARGVLPSDAPPAQYPMEQLAGDLAALLNVLGLGQADIVGYSLFSFAAELPARTGPDLVRTLVLPTSAERLTGVLVAVLRAAGAVRPVAGHTGGYPAGGLLLGATPCPALPC